MRKLCVLALFLSSSLAFATQPWEGTALSADPQAIRQAAAAIPPPASANADVLFHQHRYHFEKDGRRTETQQLVYRVDTAAAVDDWSSTSVTWAPWYQQRPTIRVRVINPDGTAHSLDPSAIVESPVTDESEDIYSDERRLRAPFPAVMAGSIVEQETVITDDRPLFDAGTVERMYFGFRVPSRLTRLILDFPEGMPLRYQPLLLKDVAIQKLSADGRTIVTFESGPMDPVEDAEPNLPGDVAGWPQVRFSTGSSWQAIASRYHAVVENKIAASDLTATLAGIHAPDHDRAALIRSVFELLHRDVRYTGVEFGDSSIIPHTPAEVLKTHYGDCKDKSALLVAMLRAVGVPAYVALLDTGIGTDVTPDLPGLGMFDHAIVYVPGPPDIWLDATAEFSRIDALDFSDQGRLALIVRPETTSLVKTPELPSSADILVERREVLLPENGPAQIIETSQPQGLSESDYRSWYGGADTKDVRKRLEEYVKDHYSAESLGPLEHTPGNDMSRPFELTMRAEKAHRGYVDTEKASLYIPTANLYTHVPEFLRTAPKRAENGTQLEDDRRKHDAVFRPFVSEWRYHIVPPPGFTARSLPPDSQRTFGPAVLTSHFEVASDSSVTAVLRFDAVRSHWTAAEVEIARKAFTDYAQTDIPAVHFDLTAALELQNGKVREGIAGYQRLIALHPREALHHSQLAMGLLAAGIGDAARLEARKATELEPSSARAWETLGWVLQHDFLARRFSKGWDMAGSTAAYHKAIQLDPDLIAAAIDFAVSLEHDQRGARYADKVRLANAIEQYRRVHDKLPDYHSEDNLLIALAYAERFAELVTELDHLPSSTARDQLRLVAAACTQGLAPAIVLAGNRAAAPAQRFVLLNGAADYLLRLRRYELAAGLLDEAARGRDDAASITARANATRRAKPFEKLLLPADDPRNLAQQLVLRLAGVTERPWETFFSKHVVPAKGLDKDTVEALVRVSNVTRRSLERLGFPVDVVLDLGMANVQLTVDGSPESGFRVTQQAGKQVENYYVVSEDGGFRLISATQNQTGIPAYALWCLEHNDLTTARHWLDWEREDTKLAGGDDVLAGALFPHFWTRGQEGDSEAVRLAASVALARSDQTEAVLPVLLRFRDTVPDGQKLYLDYALAQAYSKLKNYSELHPVALRLVASAPESPTALRMLATSDSALSLNDATPLLEQRLRRFPNDHDTLSTLAWLAARRGDFKAAAAYEHQLIEAGRALPTDFNSYGWNLLFSGAAGSDVEQVVERSAQQNKEDAALLHTLAAIYAENGKTREARELLLKCMDLWGLDEPNTEIWYVYARIAEQYGLDTAAGDAYRRVTRPDFPWMENGSTYQLAQRRLAALKGTPSAPARTAKR
jgi:tetratricopeptide (TPR) repeat protein